jgi:hypothetical protein
MSTSVTFNGTVYAIPAAGELNWSALASFLVDVGNTAGLNTTRKQAIRKCTTTPVTVSATTDYAIVTDMASPSAVVVNLPAGVAGLTIAVVDGKGDALTNNITINRNGADTIAGSTSLVLNQNRQAVALQYNSGDTDWKIIYNAGGTSGTGGSGEKNYLAASASSATGWTASGAGVTVANDTTAADLPRPNTTGTGFKVSGVSGSTAYAYARFILDDADAAKKLKLQFDMKPVSGYVASDFKVDVYSNTASDYTTGNTRLALSTDSSSVTALPALTGTYRTTFDAPAISAKYIEVRIGLNGTNTHACVFSDLIVGPGVMQQGAAATEWASYTPTLGFTVNGTGGTSVKGRWRRIGDSMEIEASVGNGSGGAATGTTVSFSLPTGYTIDTTKVSQGSSSLGYASLGSATFFNGTSYLATGGVTYASTTAVGVLKQSGAAIMAGSDVLTSAQLGIHAVIPIAEWAGSGTVNVVQNDAEYQSNSSTSDAADTTSFVSGPSGSAFPGALTANRSKRIRFNTPIQAGDMIRIEVDPDGVGDWAGLSDSRIAGSNDATHGMTWQRVSSSTTDVDVNFGSAGFNVTGLTAAAAWSTLSSGKWRVKKVSGGQAVGFSEVQPGVSSGLVSANGLKATATNDSAPAGYVGEYMIQGLAFASRTSVTTATTKNVTTNKITLTPGDWDVTGVVSVLPAASTTVQYVDAGISKTSATEPNVSTSAFPTNGEIIIEQSFGSIAYGATIITVAVPTTRVSVSTNTDIYLVMQAGFGVSTMTSYGSFWARRIR